MKVLLVTPSYDPIVGGAETFVRRLATTLNELGTHADVMTLHMNQKWKPFLNEASEKSKFTVFRIPAISNPLAFLPTNPLHRMFRINVVPKPGFTRLFRGYDIIHFCDEEDLGFPLFSLFVKKPKIMHLLTPIGFEAIRRNFFQREVFKRIANIYIPDSFQIRFLQQIGIAKSKIVNMESIGVNTCTFKPNESKRADSLVLFVGRLQKLKGVLVLLQSLSTLKIPVHLVIIGPSNPRDPEYSNEIKNKVQLINSQGTHKVELLGCMSEKELVTWYQRATVLVTPHLDGSAGLTTLEALACGTPVIATGTLLIKNGVNGLIVPPNDVERLTSALGELLDDKVLRKKYGSNGRMIIEAHYSWEKIVKDLVRVYEKMIEN
jgi:glycosyltransferase involved in cell wall biosynthesis